MKYLKKFESKFTVPDEIIEDLKDILSDLMDDGYTVSYNFNCDYGEYIDIYKYTDGKKSRMSYSEIIECVERVNIYLKQEGLKVRVYDHPYGNVETTNKDETSFIFELRISRMI